MSSSLGHPRMKDFTARHFVSLLGALCLSTRSRFDAREEPPVKRLHSQTILGAYPCSWLDVRRASRLGVVHIYIRYCLARGCLLVETPTCTCPNIQSLVILWPNKTKHEVLSKGNSHVVTSFPNESFLEAVALKHEKRRNNGVTPRAGGSLQRFMNSACTVCVHLLASSDFTCVMQLAYQISLACDKASVQYGSSRIKPLTLTESKPYSSRFSLRYPYRKHFLLLSLERRLATTLPSQRG